MKPASFAYHRARDVAGAARLLAELAERGEDAKLLAGGQSLIPMMNFRLARPGHLVDIGGLAELAYLRPDGTGGLRIGALTTHHTVETAAEAVLGRDFAVLRDAMPWIGHLPIRTRGTVGGSLAHGDSTAEWCLLALLLDAEITAVGPHGERTIPAAEFFHGFYTTALEADEVLAEIRFPRPAPHAALAEFAERRGDFAIVSAAVDLDVDDAGAVVAGRVALGGVAPAPLRIPEAEEVLATGGPDRAALFAACADRAAEAADPPSDMNGSADYRRTLIRTLIRRACEEAISR
ncbi:FAD binding domain-containing protein [Yinghuangia soli]|uniref:Xanthine dehydrogenase family protein subunit M n=1 Tax=Yinghuangia soli TaxID=2908204 RepID=A0AA41PXX0_9ACTN|nr:xanthine dehydrogenase family protein subunit M [Yinghuangia soli]MCF2527944.1 xanthine dehydrogenase family protein subunit M [Yinghuangia soli]